MEKKGTLKVVFASFLLAAGGISLSLVANSSLDPPLGYCPSGPDVKTGPNISALGGQAANFDGRKPHLVTLVDIPTVWTGDAPLDLTPSDWKADSLGELQLVICQYRPDPKIGASIGSCGDYERFGERAQVPVIASTYTYRIYAASTGELVRTVTVRGKEYDCPRSIDSGVRDQPHVNALPTADEITAALSPIVGMSS